MSSLPALGIDIGRVIISAGVPGHADTSFLRGSLEDALDTPPMEGAIEAIAMLVKVFDGRVWLVSKAGTGTQARTRAWLSHHRFFEQTGIAEFNLRFCRERHEKAGICATLEITHFIDDRADVLLPMAGVVEHRILFGPQRAPVPGGLTSVNSWEEVRRLLLAESSSTAAGRIR